MKGADYKEVIAFMEERENAHADNPFAFATTPSKEHIVEEDKTEETEKAPTAEKKDEE